MPQLIRRHHNKNKKQNARRENGVEPLITNDAAVLGILLAILAIVFKTSNSSIPFFQKFYRIVPSVLLCYFIPSLLNSFGIISGEKSNLYFFASRFLLPASLVLLCIGIDIKAIARLGPKAIIMAIAGTVGVLLGGPLAILIVSVVAPDVVGGAGPDAVWRGLATVAGSWIGGGPNQVAMREIFQPSDELFSIVLTVDVIVGYMWMGVLLFGIGHAKKFDRLLKADASAIDEVKKSISNYRASISRKATSTDIMMLLAIAFVGTAFAHIGADALAPWLQETFPILDKFSLTKPFFWIVMIATTIGFLLSFTRLKNYEGAGASDIGSVFIYILIATIGMRMDITAAFRHPALFVVGAIWILIHALILIIVARLIKAPYFFLAVGSQANIGGAASAPVLASAFDRSLISVGVILAMFGYALGTYAGWLTAILMQFVSQ